MDLLFTKYASPFSFMDAMIQNSKFCEFITKVVKAKHEADEWEIYLHKVWDKSFGDFKKEIQLNQQHQHMSTSQMENTIHGSMDILNRFNPEGG